MWLKHPWHGRPGQQELRGPHGSVWTAYHVQVPQCHRSVCCSAPGKHLVPEREMLHKLTGR